MNNINEPMNTINEPMNTINEPMTTINEPTNTINEPMNTINESMTTIKEHADRYNLGLASSKDSDQSTHLQSAQDLCYLHLRWLDIPTDFCSPAYEGCAKSSFTNRLPLFYPWYILKCFTALQWCE